MCQNFFIIFEKLFAFIKSHDRVKSRILSFSLVFILSNIFCPKFFAQVQSLRFIHRTSEDGLSQNCVNSIIQDRKGFIWIATNEGLDRYDGYEFKVFNKGDRNGMISDDYITCILKDNENNIWVGTGSGGLNKYNTKTERFIQIKFDSVLESFGDMNYIRSIIEDNQDNIWFIAGNTIDRIDHKTKKIDFYIPHDVHSNTINLNVLFIDSFGDLWFGTGNNGLGLFKVKEKTFKYFRMNPQNRNSISDNDIRTIYEDSQKNLWIGTYNGGFDLYHRSTETFTRFTPVPSTLASLSVKSILENGKNKLWIGTRNGLFIFDKRTKKFSHYIHDPYNPYSITQNNIQVIFKDSDGNLWIGTKRGINILNKEAMLFTHYRADPYNEKCLNNSYVTSILEDKKGFIWFGTNGGGINKFNLEKGTFTYYTHDSKKLNSITSNDVNALAQDKRGNIWIGTNQGGLNLFIPKSDQFFHYKLNPNKPFIYQSTISSLLYCNNGLLWIGTNDKLMTYDIKKQEFHNFPLSNNKSGIIITCLVKGKRNNIWVGTGNSKFYEINLSTFGYKLHTLPSHSKITRINSIFDNGNYIWIGTSGGGLMCFNKKQNRYKIYTKAEGLADNFIYGILKDKNNNLWISTLNGLSKFNTVTKKFINFYKENGIQNNQFTPGYLATHKGIFFMGDIDGAISFTPENISTTPYNTPIVFTNFRIFNRPVIIDGKNGILTSPINECKKIFLPYSQSSFTFTFAALDYTMGNKVEYAYIMKGFENNWNYVENRRYATYTNLDPGKYTFMVKAANNMGQWSKMVASITISISPPYWESWWFITLILLLLGLIVWHLAKYQIQKKNLIKTRMLANLTQLKLLRNQMNPHFLLNVFSVIRAFILIDKNTAWEMISKLSEYFRYVLFNYNKENATLNEEIDAVKNYINIQKVCFHESLDVSCNINDDALGLIVPAFIFQPLVENAIKYGSQTSMSQFKIKLNINFEHDVLTIDVANTGKLNQLETIDSNGKDGHGTSIKNIKKRLDIMFKDHFTFQLFEIENWVHAVIRIEYIPLNKKSKSIENERNMRKELV